MHARTHAHARAHACTHTCTHARTHARTRMHACTHTCTRARTRMHACTHSYTLYSFLFFNCVRLVSIRMYTLTRLRPPPALNPITTTWWATPSAFSLGLMTSSISCKRMCSNCGTYVICMFVVLCAFVMTFSISRKRVCAN